MSRGTNESVCYLNVSSASRTAPGPFKQTNEGNMSIRACHAPGPAPQPGNWLDSGQLYIHRSNLYRLATNIFAEDFLEGLPGFLSIPKIRFLLLFGLGGVFFQAHFLNETLKFQPSPQIRCFLCR